MSLLAEEVVEEWLNRQGYFTIRGVKIGIHEMDLLAVRPCNGGLERRHIEVTASVRPISYLTGLPREVRKATGRKASAKRRSDDELQACVAEWITKKWEEPRKAQLRSRLAPGPWSRELVVHEIKYQRELDLIAESGITIHRLGNIVRELKSTGMAIEGAAGAHLLELVALLSEQAKVDAQ
jgi:hypothetical protein